jgi:excisionase family DNA binding protein
VRIDLAHLTGQEPLDQQQRLAYSPAEVAAAVGLSRKAIYRAIASGELRAARLCSGSRLLIPVAEARDWVTRNLVAAEAVPTSGRFERGTERRTPLMDALRRAA